MDDIPEASLAENTDFSVIEKPKKSDDPLEPSVRYISFYITCLSHKFVCVIERILHLY